MHLRGLLLSGTRITRAPEGDQGAAPAPALAPAAAPAPAAAAPAAEPAPAPAAAGPVRPEGLPDDLWDDAAGVKTGDLWSKYQDAQGKLTEAEQARGTVPADASGYELKFPDGHKAPEGVTLDPADPFLKDAQSFAKEHGWSTGQFSQAVALEAMRRANMAKAAQTNHTAEIAKLGDNSAGRIAAVKTWATANMPANEAAALMGSLHSADAVMAMERVMKMRTGPVPGPAQSANPPALEGKFGSSRLAAIASQAA